MHGRRDIGHGEVVLRVMLLLYGPRRIAAPERTRHGQSYGHDGPWMEDEEVRRLEAAMYLATAY